MRTFIQPGKTITLTAPGDVSAGDPIKVGQLFGVVATSVANGDPMEVMTVGVHELPKHAGDTPGEGALLFWDDGNSEVTTVASGNLLIGCATEAAAGGDATVKVRLSGTPRADEP